MARSSEKSMAMLNRWVSMKETIVKSKNKNLTRPKHTLSVDSIAECEYWRSQIIREVSRKISDIQNASLGEHRIRHLNDDINASLKEKDRWEYRIRDLGGPDYRGRAGRMALDSFGVQLMGDDGYKYFGAAKDLPGVRELFEKDPLPPPKRSKGDLFRCVSADYFGWRDEDDGEILLAEQAMETSIADIDRYDDDDDDDDEEQRVG